jgi:SOS response associated peptidase (SRAP)
MIASGHSSLAFKSRPTSVPVQVMRLLFAMEAHGVIINGARAANAINLAITSFPLNPCRTGDTRPKVTHWFALDGSRPLFAFAGIWRLSTGERKGETGEHQLFAFLTTASNDVVRPIHGKAMPVLLTTEQEFDRWLHAPVNDAIALQRPLPNELLRIVARGEKRDQAPVDK